MKLILHLEKIKRGEIYNDLYEKIEGLLPGATSAGLANTYKNAGTAHKKSAFWWSVFMGGALVIIMWVARWGVGEITSGGLDMIKTWEGLGMFIFRILPFEGPLIFFVWKANQKSNQHLRLAEEYLHKETISANFEGLRKAAREAEQSQSEDSLETVFFGHTFDAYAYNPSKTLDNEKHKETPFSDLLKVATTSVKQINEICSLCSDTSKKAMDFLADSKYSKQEKNNEKV